MRLPGLPLLREIAAVTMHSRIKSSLAGVADSPESLSRAYLLVAAASMLAILSLAGFGMNTIYHRHIIRTAEHTSVSIGYAVFAASRKMLTTPDRSGNVGLSVDASARPLLNERMKHYLHPLNIFKIKIYSPDTVILYSTDPSVIGKTDWDNPLLHRALKGDIASKIVKKGSVLDLEGEMRSDVDVVETYLPVIDDRHAIIGCFEIYMDVTHAHGEIFRVVSSSLMALAATLLLVFGILFLIVRRLSLQLSRSRTDLEKLATTDMLTGILNRRHLIEHLNEEFLKIGRASEKGRQGVTGLIMVDIDHFKNINDTYGHAAGDEVLKQLSTRIRASLRKYDLFGRYGGEEFLLILPGTSLEDTNLVSERTMALIRNSPFPVGQHAFRITVSMGVAALTPHDPDIESAIHRADESLYTAKKEGRNRIGRVAASPIFSDGI